MDRRDRLPTLAEVIKRETKPPVDLYCFYLWLQKERSEDVLDFWLDAQQHENLCRAYFKDLRKSGRTVQEDWPQYYDYARRRGSIFNKINGIQRDAKLADGEKSGSDLMMDFDKPSMERPSLGPADGTAMRSPTPTFPRDLGGHLSPTLQQLYNPGSPDVNEFMGRRSLGSRREPVQPIIQRNAAITRTDLIASAEVIYAKYLLPSADKEIYLPAPLRIENFSPAAERLPHSSSPRLDMDNEALARIPDMFSKQKEYVYRAMEADAFPRFLRAKSFGNLTPISALLRLSTGLFALWAGLATAFALIFLDKPKHQRLWIILPFAIAVLFTISYTYDLDPVLVFLGLSETTPFRTIRIREPYVKKVLIGRSIWVTILTIIVTACLTLVFALVPGHRL